MFRPNLDPDYEAQAEPESEDQEQEVGQGLLPTTQKFEEEKQGSSAGDTTEASNQNDKQDNRKRTEYAVDSDEAMEDEERRIIATARQLNKQRQARSRSKAKGLKRSKL